MLEIILCSLVTVLPDYLFRRYAQGKRIGREITFTSVWYELRYGLTGCLILAVLMITVIFYFHPTATRATSLFRSVPIVPEVSGRVAEVFVGPREVVTAGQPLFRLDASSQEAAVESARLKIDEIDAATAVAQSDLAAAEGQFAQATGALKQAQEELATKAELRERNPANVPLREVERLQIAVDTRQGAVDAFRAMRDAEVTRITVLLPAQRASAAAALAEAEVELGKTVVTAGIDGQLEQFSLRPGEIVNPFMRPAGVLVPKGGTRRIAAGFGQIEAQVIRRGLIAEASCPSVPLTVIPMVIVEVQEVISSGQVRTSDQLVDVTALGQAPGTVLAFLEPLYEGGLDAVPAGASCVVNAYTSHHDVIASGEVTGTRALVLHAVDALGMVHAILLRAQTLLMPVRLLVLSGH